MAAAQCWKSLLVLAALTYSACGSIASNGDNDTVTQKSNSTCEGAKLVMGECTVFGGLAKGVTAAAFAGDSGTGADGACALSGHAPKQQVKTLISSVVALKFGTDLDGCCKAKEALDKCKSLTYTEYDSEVTITTQGGGSIGDGMAEKNDTDTAEANGTGDNSSGETKNNNTAPNTDVVTGDNSTTSAAAPQFALALLGAMAAALAMAAV